MAKTISHCQGKGSLTHNNRTFNAKNVDSSRTPDNVIFKQQPIGEAYDFLFSSAVQRYNDKQKRADRKIKTSYFEHAFKRSPASYVVTAADKRKSFYEDVVQIGTMNDTGCGTADAEIAAACLAEYVNGFQERNPNFFLFNAVLHNDEATPHLHIDYIPVGHYKQGVDTQNGIAQALKEMGYGTGKDAINHWRESERAVLEKICAAHGIEISAPQKSRGSLVVDEYKEYAQIKEKVEEKRQEEQQLDTELEQKSAALSETAAELEKNAEKLSQISNIDSIETKKTLLGGKISLAAEDYEKVSDLAKKQIAAENNEEFLRGRVSALAGEKRQLAEKNEHLTEQVAELKKKNSELNSVRGDMALAKLRTELESLKRTHQRVLDFIEKIGLMDKLQAFLRTNTQNIKKMK